MTPRTERHLWVLRSGGPWGDLPERYGPRSTCYNRFVRWRKADVAYSIDLGGRLFGRSGYGAGAKAGPPLVFMVKNRHDFISFLNREIARSSLRQPSTGFASFDEIQKSADVAPT